MKWKISWWLSDAVDGIKRGYDIIETNEIIEEDYAQELLDGHALGNPKHKLQNFSDAITCASSPLNFKVIKVTKVVERLK